ncbi:CLUMA_CG021660, isoform A [Clunio marinus]|uniref:CLUMA_CG021660, isoform A n=1 Tax=Clunio marinus TaxID=568069 RepID=A0A1J1J7H2_9DIPT|nr:CLUMA_CG021660, isoform A [Clunio marinus]
MRKIYNTENIVTRPTAFTQEYEKPLVDPIEFIDFLNVRASKCSFHASIWKIAIRRNFFMT